MDAIDGEVPLGQTAGKRFDGLRVGVLFNLKKGVQAEAPDEEAELDSMETVQAIGDALREGGAEVVPLEADAELPRKLAEARLSIAFNIAEGLRGRGREAQVPALLNMLGIPFTGSDETTLCVALDKALTKRLLNTYRVRAPRGAVLSRGTGAGETARLPALRYPVIVKPNAEGSSKGISEVSVARDARALRALIGRGLNLYGEDMLAEEYIEGREFTVGVLGNGANARVFRPMEILFRQETQAGCHVYSYGVKREYERYIDYRCPAELPPDAEAEMIRATRRVFDALGCRDFARVDYRLAPDGKLYFIEVNPLPGLAPGYSDYPMLAAFNGVAYGDLVRGVLDAALVRCGLGEGRVGA